MKLRWEPLWALECRQTILFNAARDLSFAATAILESTSEADDTALSWETAAATEQDTMASGSAQGRLESIRQMVIQAASPGEIHAVLLGTRVALLPSHSMSSRF